MIEKVGNIVFGGKIVDVYDSLDEPLFLLTEIAALLDYSYGYIPNLLAYCEEDEKKKVTVSGTKLVVDAVNEHGLYNILSQSNKPIARGWRRIIHDELIRIRKNEGKDIHEQFEEWDHALDDIYFDEETGKLMQSVTMPGGDVEQVELA